VFSFNKVAFEHPLRNHHSIDPETQLRLDFDLLTLGTHPICRRVVNPVAKLFWRQYENGPGVSAASWCGERVSGRTHPAEASASPIA
jgi:hypothetical protein